MKRWIHSVTEPSSVEYGKAISEGRKRLNDRFEPFEISNTYFNRYATSSTGYRITLDDQEWIADNRGDSWNDLKLYGPFAPSEVNSWSELFRYQPIREFKTLNNVMTYLFNEVSIEEE